jgi:hypothetical protein
VAVAITIDSTDVLAYVLRGSLRIQKDDAVETLSLVTRDPVLTSSAYRPSLGDVVQVKVVKIDKERGRVGLSMRM